MRVNVDSKAMKDPRFKRLGRLLGVDWHEGLGLCLEVWMYASEARSEFMTAADVDAVVDRDGFGQAMAAAELAEPAGERLRLRGVRKRIGYLDQQAEKGRAGGLKSAAVRRAKKSAHLEANAEAAASTLLKQRSSPPDLVSDPAPDLTLFPDQAPTRAVAARGSNAPRSRGRASVTIAPPGTRDAIAYFCDRYQAKYGHKCTPTKRQAGEVQRLVARHGLDEVKRRIYILFDAPPAFLARGGAPDLATLVQHFDKLVESSANLAQPALAPTSAVGRAEPAPAEAHAADAARGATAW